MSKNSPHYSNSEGHHRYAFGVGSKRLNTFLSEHRFWIIVSAFLILFFSLTPLQVDDYTFYASSHTVHDLSSFISINHYFYDHVNGRILGNGLSLIAANSRVVSVLFRATITLVTLITATKLLGIRMGSRRNLLVTLLFFVPVNMFSVTYAWAAGFYNYVTPLMLLMFILYMMLHSDPIPARKESLDAKGLVRFIVMFILAFGASLFVENITVAGVIVGLALVVVALVRKRVAVQLPIALLLGFLGGAFVMFSSPVYHSIAEGHSKYQKISKGFGGVLDQVATNTQHITSYLINDAILLYVAAFLIIVLLLVKERNRLSEFSYTKKAMIFVGVFSFVYILFAPYINEYNGHPDRFQMLLSFVELLAVSGMFLSIFTLTAVTVYSKTMRDSAMWFVGLAVITTAPLLFVSPLSPRVFYVPYAFMVLYLFTLINYVLTRYSEFELRAESHCLLNKATSYTLLAFSILVLCIFGAIRMREIQNTHLAKVQIQQGKSDIVLKKYPFPRFTYSDKYLSPWPSMYFSNSKCTYRKCDQIHIRVVYR